MLQVGYIALIIFVLVIEYICSLTAKQFQVDYWEID